jgi:four helix bundle protein
MNELQQKTKKLAINTIRFVASLNRSMTADVIGKQLLRSGTSVGANYRAAIRSKSPADFIAKMGIVEEEADECMFWMELLLEIGITTLSQVKELQSLANQVVAMTVSSIKTARSKYTKNSEY